MGRPSLGLLPKLVLYLNFLLWQLGSGASGQSTDTGKPKLPEDEVSALKAIADNLEVKPAPNITDDYCNNRTNNFFVDCELDENNSTRCHVISMRLDNQGLTGVIPPEVGSLSYLKTLDLSNNKLNGTIPSLLGYLYNLRFLDLSNNQLTGSIPSSLRNLDDLRYLRLGNNFLDGPIPGSLGSLTNLYSLQLQFNRLTGPIPDEFGMLRNLSTLSIAGNYISGPIPDFITNWTQIRYLSFLGNKFEGKLTKQILDFPDLWHLSISDVAYSLYEFPSTANNTDLVTLILRNCSIGGTIPKYIAHNMSSLKHLDLSFNNLTGELPDYMPANLIYMSFAENQLNGTIPAWIFLAVQTRMDLSFNNFLEVEYDQVPRNLDLNLFACCRSSVSTAATHLNDPVQMMNTYCPGRKAKYYSLFINCGGGETNVNGSIYDQDTDTSHFYTSPKHNWAYSFSGDFAGEGSSNFSDSSVCTQNMTCGISIADASLYDKARLSPLSLKYFAFCLCKGNYTVTLRFAEIVYGDDEHYTSLRKRAFDVYIQRDRKLNYFNIKDQVGGPDQPITKKFSAVPVTNGLMEIHLYWPGMGSTHSPDYYGDQPTLNGPLISAISVTPDFNVADEKVQPLYVALITIASIVIALPLLVVFAWRMGLLRSTKLRKINIGQDKYATVKELIAATGKFSDKKKIGSGGFGIVYEAKLQGQTVAVKKLSSHFRERIKELKTEISTISVLKHSNLIKLLDIHIEKHLQFLVYEYMENRSLADALFDPRSKLKLTWEIRYNICLGIARGLEYLHEHPRLKIVHMNIKAANILLDGNLEAKISDFGLASIYPEEDQVMVIKKEVSQGYTAPEYFQGNATSKADVYSFGVVLLEIVSGKKNVSKSNQETELLIDMAHKAHEKGKLKDLVDKNLYTCNFKQALTILNLAVKCTSVARSMRPTMSEVVSELLGKKNNEDGEKTKASEELTNVDSTTSAELASIASTSSPFFKGTDIELENISVVPPQKS